MKYALAALVMFIFPCFVWGSLRDSPSKFHLKGKPMVVVVPSYNNMGWFQANIDSIISQDYPNYRIIYIDDCSNDGMSEALTQYLKEKKVSCQLIDFDENVYADHLAKSKAFSQKINSGHHFFFTLVRNVKRCGAFENLFRAIYSCRNEEIVVTVDGDDWLLHVDVLQKLNSIYSTKDVWLTHGNLQEFPSGNVGWCQPVPEEIILANKFREFRCPSHLRTFYAWLFKKIRIEDLLWKDKFFSMTWDMAMMFPMVEMCAERHAFVKDVNYGYNMANQINDNKVNAKLQRRLDKHIRHMPRYKRLAQLPLD